MGKEKILMSVVNATNKTICVSKQKKRMLECVSDAVDHEAFGDDDMSFSTSHLLLANHTTTDCTKSNIHCIPMNVCGNMNPYFKPDFNAVARYAEGHKLGSKSYERVFAFIPTGWAGLGKWNLEHSRNTGVVKLDDGTMMDVTIVLVPYSEHSSFSELEEFVSFLKPTIIQPTVFGDEKRKDKMVKHFMTFGDRKENLKEGFKKMFGGGTGGGAKKTAPQQPPVVKSVKLLSAPVMPASSVPDDGILATLVEMGFEVSAARTALKRAHNDVTRAAALLLDPQGATGGDGGGGDAHDADDFGAEIVVAPTKKKSRATIDSFFGSKKLKK
jgi:hypothetical protein